MLNKRTEIDQNSRGGPQKKEEVGRVLYPVRVTAWKNDFTVEYEVIGGGKHNNEREAIKELTRDSLRNMAFVAHNTPVQFDVMVTLTYPNEYPSDGKEVKRHLKWFIVWMGRSGGVASYFWFMEFQRRGAPHFHIFTSGGELLKMKTAVSEHWYKIVDSGDTKHLKAGTRVEKLRRADAAGRYAAKYAGKPHQKKVPQGYQDVGRWWGHSRDVKPIPLEIKEIDSWDDLEQLTRGWSHHGLIRRQKPMKTLFNATRDVIKTATDLP